MKTHNLRRVVFFCFIALGLLVGQSAWAAPQADPMETLEGQSMVFLYMGEEGGTLRVPPPADFDPERAALAPNATFNINYLPAGVTNAFGYTCYTWPEQAKAPFNYAAAIWQNILTSPVPITIDACWAEMGYGILGGSGTDAFYHNFPGSVSNTVYQAGLANAIVGYDINPAKPEIHIVYNRSAPWYYGTDGNTPYNQIDFASVVLHEIAHGLNFSGFMTVSNGIGWWQFEGEPGIYDRFTENGSGQPLINFPDGSSDLGSQLTSGNLYFDGPNVRQANGGNPAKLYAPSPWRQGSSYSHLDEIFNGTSNSLMTYSVNYGESMHDPGPITRGLLKDIGWNITPANTAPQWSPLPSQRVAMNGSANNAIDLWAYAQDKESADSLLTFSITNTSDPNAGVSIDSNRYIDISPAPGWTGSANITIQVTDPGSLLATTTLQVNVARLWNGSASRDWHTAANWTPSGVPAAGDNVVIPDVTRDPQLSADAVVQNLTIDPGAALDLGTRTLNVNGSLLNRGALSQTRAVAPASTATFLQITNLAGTQVKYYGLEISAASAEANVVVTISGQQGCTGFTRGVQRCFNLTPDAAISGTLRFYYSEAERNWQNSSLLAVYQEMVTWDKLPGPFTVGGSGDSQYVTVQGAEVDSNFALAMPGKGFLPAAKKAAK